MAVTEPFNVAPVEETLEAADVVTEGELAGINERTFPYVVPAEFTPFIWKKYSCPEVKLVALAVTVAVVVVEVVDAVGLDVQVNAPETFVAPEVAKQNVIAVLAPLALIDPFNVAEVAPIEVAAFVVAVGKPAAIVKVKVFVAVVGWESVTLKVKLLETTDSVGVPVI